MKIVKKYYPFWIGLIICMGLVGLGKDFISFAVFSAYIMGYHNLTDFNKFE